jgi:hypothetical protein
MRRSCRSRFFRLNGRRQLIRLLHWLRQGLEAEDPEPQQAVHGVDVSEL